MDDGEIRALCHRFFDALERRDVKTLGELYHDDLAFWFNASGRTSTREESLKAIADGYSRHRRRLYNDRIVNTFNRGFVMQYTLNITHHDGRKTTLFPCVVALCHAGRIVRMDEYIDSGKFSQARPANDTQAAGAAR
jgi:ketosteroid isomerase-like protein